MSIVRYNLMTVADYTPYCGAAVCRFVWPRTKFDGEQFVCTCGWRSAFDREFISEYRATLTTPNTSTPEESHEH